MTPILESSGATSAAEEQKTQQLMKAIAVFPGRPNSVHLAQLPKPRVSDIPGGRGVRVWRARRAAVVGAGTVGLLATLVLRLRGLEVTAFGRTPRPYLNSDLVETLGAGYETTVDLPLVEGARKHGPFDLIFEATG